MLEELMRECRNWFKVPDGAYSGTFTIKDGSITLPFLVDGQYFRIIGSVFNDGVHQYGAGGLTDETFDGAVWALAVPAAFISLVEDVEAWRNSCPDCYTVAQFAKDHSDGTYILAMATHVVCVQNGDWLDTWDSGDEVPLYYWQKG